MKRMLSALVATMMIVWPVFGAAAQEPRKIEETGASLSREVKAVFEAAAGAKLRRALIVSGIASVHTEDVTVRLSGGEAAFDAGVQMVVRRIAQDDAEAFAWFSGLMKGIGAKIFPFDIYFEKDGQRIQPRNTIRLGVTLPDGFGKPVVRYVTTEGGVTALAVSQEDGSALFETDRAGYYVLADAGQGGGKTPETGEPFSIALFAAIASSLGLAVLYMKRPKKAARH